MYRPRACKLTLTTTYYKPMKLIITLVILLMLANPLICLAQQQDKPVFENPVEFLKPGDKSIPEIVGSVIKIVLGIVGVVALILFITAGFIWMSAQGNTDKIKKAQDIMIWAAIGLLIIFASYALLSLVFGFRGKIGEVGPSTFQNRPGFYSSKII